jgi:Flp pilus assembly secretin CpaC
MMKGIYAAAVIALSFVPAILADADDGVLVVGLGRISVVHAKQSIATVAVGDPEIADVAIEGDRSVMVFGKKSGQTDLVLMNDAHQPIVSSHILVGAMGGSDVIIIRRPGKNGIDAEPWYCAPGCQPFGGEAGKK